MLELSNQHIEVVAGGFGTPSAMIGGIAGCTKYLTDTVLSNASVTIDGLATAIISGAAISAIDETVESVGLKLSSIAMIGMHTGYRQPWALDLNNT